MTTLSSTLRIFGTADDSIVDGPGIRFAIFTQGCKHCCRGCHNPEAQPFDGGNNVTVEELWQKIEGNPLVSGITLTGGEPCEQPTPLIELACRAHEKGLNVWAYSGYTYAQLMAGTPSDDARELARVCDVLVDGLFIESQQSHELKWRGSSNQRIIDVPASFEAGEAVEWEQ
jgi:anaerobic ribonucleoside-triphosphate reductase activating protein